MQNNQSTSYSSGAAVRTALAKDTGAIELLGAVGVLIVAGGTLLLSVVAVSWMIF